MISFYCFYFLFFPLISLASLCFEKLFKFVSQRLQVDNLNLINSLVNIQPLTWGQAFNHCTLYGVPWQELYDHKYWCFQFFVFCFLFFVFFFWGGGLISRNWGKQRPMQPSLPRTSCHVRSGSSECRKIPWITTRPIGWLPRYSFLWSNDTVSLGIHKGSGGRSERAGTI